MSKIHDSSISLSLVIFFSFFTVLLLESLKDQWKSGGKMFKLSKLRPYTSERLEIIELFENWNGMLPKIIKSRKNNSTPFRRFLRLDSGVSRFSWSRNGHETPAPSHFKTRMAYLGGDHMDVCCRTSLMSSMPSVVSCSSGSLDSKYF